jgi:hypothetical protein
MVKILQLEVQDAHGVHSLEFSARAMINLGYAGRNEAAVRHHIEELAKEGVAPPASIPMCIPMPVNALTTDSEIEVMSEKTSGEVEIAFLHQGGNVYVGIGSDHTDRELERANMALSKQVCANVVSKRVWNLDDVKKQWDELVMQSWVSDESGNETLYQSASLGTLLPFPALLKCAGEALKNPDTDGLVIYSGTVGLLKSKFIYAPGFRCELTDPALKRSLECRYRVRTLSSMYK